MITSPPKTDPRYGLAKYFSTCTTIRLLGIYSVSYVTLLVWSPHDYFLLILLFFVRYQIVRISSTNNSRDKIRELSQLFHNPHVETNWIFNLLSVQVRLIVLICLTTSSHALLN